MKTRMKNKRLIKWYSTKSSSLTNLIFIDCEEKALVFVYTKLDET